MFKLLYGVLAWAMGGLVQTMLVGAGLSLVVYAALSPLIEGFLQDAVFALNGLPQVAVQFLLLAGVGEALSILGSAILTRLAISSAANVAGLKVSS
jgi:uncharacterized protein DUF2523